LFSLPVRGIGFGGEDVGICDCSGRPGGFGFVSPAADIERLTSGGAASVAR